MAISREAKEVRLRWLEGTRGPNPDEVIEVTAEGFTVKRMLMWPFKPKLRSVVWKDVTEIQACIRDCFSCHPMILYFMRDGKKDFQVDELMGGYATLLEEVLKIFPDFDISQYDEVEGYFPGEGCQVCWKC